MTGRRRTKTVRLEERLHKLSERSLRYGKDTIAATLPLHYIECIVLRAEEEGKTVTDVIREAVYERHKDCIDRMALPVRAMLDEELRRRVLQRNASVEV